MCGLVSAGSAGPRFTTAQGAGRGSRSQVQPECMLERRAPGAVAYFNARTRWFDPLLRVSPIGGVEKSRPRKGNRPSKRRPKRRVPIPSTVVPVKTDARERASVRVCDSQPFSLMPFFSANLVELIRLARQRCNRLAHTSRVTRLATPCGTRSPARSQERDSPNRCANNSAGGSTRRKQRHRTIVGDMIEHGNTEDTSGRH